MPPRHAPTPQPRGLNLAHGNGATGVPGAAVLLTAPRAAALPGPLALAQDRVANPTVAATAALQLQPTCRQQFRDAMTQLFPGQESTQEKVFSAVNAFFIQAELEFLDLPALAEAGVPFWNDLVRAFCKLATPWFDF